MSNWYALHTRSHFENRVADALREKGFESFLAAFDEVHQWKDRKRRVSIPLFPGYVFVRLADRPPQRLAVMKTRGVVRILGNGDRIEPVPDSEIAAVHGLVNAKVPCLFHPFLRDGVRIRVKRGPLEGLEGYLLRMKNQTRLVISIHLISQSVAAEVDVDDVEQRSCGSRQ